MAGEEEGWREAGMAGGQERWMEGCSPAAAAAAARRAAEPLCPAVTRLRPADRAARPVLHRLLPALTSSPSMKRDGQRWETPTRGIVLGRVPESPTTLGWVGGRGPVLGCGQHPGEGRLLQPLCRDIPPTSPLAPPFCSPLAPCTQQDRDIQQWNSGACSSLARLWGAATQGAAQLLGELPEVLVLLLCAFQHGYMYPTSPAGEGCLYRAPTLGGGGV